VIWGFRGGGQDPPPEGERLTASEERVARGPEPGHPGRHRSPPRRGPQWYGAASVGWKDR